MHSKNISVVNVWTYLEIPCGWCYKFKNSLPFDEQFRSVSNLHVSKLLSSENIVDTCCLFNVMRVVRYVHSHSYVDIWFSRVLCHLHFVWSLLQWKDSRCSWQRHRDNYKWSPWAWGTHPITSWQLLTTENSVGCRCNHSDTKGLNDILMIPFEWTLHPECLHVTASHFSL